MMMLMIAMMSMVFVQFEKAMIVTLDELVAAGHGDKQYQELFAEMYVSNSGFSFHSTSALGL